MFWMLPIPFFYCLEIGLLGYTKHLLLNISFLEDLIVVQTQFSVNMMISAVCVVESQNTKDQIFKDRPWA
jgi:hypothetical protein